MMLKNISKTLLVLGLSMDHDLAMAKLNLQGLHLLNDESRKLKNYFKKLKNLDKRDMLPNKLK